MADQCRGWGRATEEEHHEHISGTEKICYYDCLGSICAITIDGLQLYPLHIRGWHVGMARV